MADQTNGLADRATNPLRTRPPEGQMMAVMKGSPSGELDTFVASVSGWHFAYQEVSEDPEDWDGEPWAKWEFRPDVLPSGERVYQPSAKKKGMLDQEFGIVFVGFGRALWNPAAPYFPFRESFKLSDLRVTCKGNVQLTIEVTGLVGLVNPYKALFIAREWRETLRAAIHAAAREYVGSRTVDEIRTTQGALRESVLRLNQGGEGLRHQIGIEIVEAHVMRCAVTNASDNMTTALQASEVNRLMAAAAGHKAKEIEMLGEAHADAASRLAAAYGSGELAAAVRRAELQRDALIETQASVVIFGNDNPLPKTPKE